MNWMIVVCGSKDREHCKHLNKRQFFLASLKKRSWEGLNYEIQVVNKNLQMIILETREWRRCVEREREREREVQLCRVMRNCHEVGLYSVIITIYTLYIYI